MTVARSLIALLGICVAIVLVGCSSEGCDNNRNSIPMAGFYDYETLESLTISGLGVTGVGAPGDSLLLDPAKSAHQVYLPFRGAEQTTSFLFTSGSLVDSLRFDYESYPYFDGEDCGAMWRYRITSVNWTGCLIDSVSVTDSLITNIERERIMIFFTVSSD